MADITDLMNRVRLELGDQKQPFRQTFRGTGFQNQFDLPASQIINDNTLSVFTTDTQADPVVNITLVQGTDYTLDEVNGIIQLTDFLTKDLLLTAQGYNYGLFCDDDLSQYVMDAVLQHTTGGSETQVTRFRDSHGFIRYEYVETTIDNLPQIEEYPVAILASVLALWSLLTDASLDIDLYTAEGTHIPRSQRFAQLQAMIAQKQSQYEQLCSLLGIGLYRISTSNLRRISRQTGRLVPVYKEREYDDNSLPIRIVVPIDAQDADPDGPLSPAGNYFW